MFTMFEGVLTLLCFVLQMLFLLFSKREGGGGGELSAIERRN